MKKIALCLLVLISGLMCAQDAMAKPKKVAVYVEGELSENERTIINSAIMSRMSSNKDYVCFERNKDFLNAMIKEVDYQTSGEVPDDEIRKIGERFGVDYVMVINAVVGRVDTYMSAKLIDLETGQVMKTADGTREGNDINTLKALAKNITYRLINKKSK